MGNGLMSNRKNDFFVLDKEKEKDLSREPIIRGNRIWRELYGQYHFFAFHEGADTSLKKECVKTEGKYYRRLLEHKGRIEKLHQQIDNEECFFEQEIMKDFLISDNRSIESDLREHSSAWSWEEEHIKRVVTLEKKLINYLWNK